MTAANEPLETFLNAARDLMSTMVMLELTEVDSGAVEDPKASLLDLVTVMRLECENGEARSLVVSMSRPLARKVVGSMLGVDEGKLDEPTDLVDGVGEVGNIIAGMAKTALAETPHAFGLTLPITVVGGPDACSLPSGGSAARARCECTGEPFQLLLWQP